MRVQLTRKDEMAWENYGFAFVIDQRVGARRQRHHRRVGLRGVVADARRPAGRRTIPATSSPACWPASSRRRSRRARRRRTRRPSPTTATRRRRTSPAASAARCGGTGTIASERVLTHTVRSPFFTGPLRSPERLQNTFAHESFMDEIAAQREGRSGRVPAAAPARSAADRRRQGGGEGGELGDAAVAAAGHPPNRRRQRPRHRRACCTKATTATARWSPRSTSIRTPARVAREAARDRATTAARSRIPTA